MKSASEMTYIVLGGALNSTHSLTVWRELDGDCRSVCALHNTSRARREADVAAECVDRRGSEDGGDVGGSLEQAEWQLG